MSNPEKLREDRLRLAAESRGLVLQPSRRPDPQAVGDQRYRLVPPLLAASETPYTLTLDDVEARLAGEG
jgi:hypothetical protein